MRANSFISTPSFLGEVGPTDERGELIEGRGWTSLLGTGRRRLGRYLCLEESAMVCGELAGEVREKNFHWETETERRR